MTTIAWDGKTMAADRGIWYGNVVVSITKLRSIEYNGCKAAVAGCGTAHRIADAIDWLARVGAYKEYSPNPPPLDKEQQILLACSDGLYVFEGPMRATELDVPFFAIGGGSEMAMGALAAGATARRAVEIVLQYGPGAMNGVDVVTL